MIILFNFKMLAAEKMGLPTIPPYLSMASKLNKSYNLFLNGVNFASGAAKIFKEDQQYVSQLYMYRHTDTQTHTLNC